MGLALVDDWIWGGGAVALMTSLIRNRFNAWAAIVEEQVSILKFWLELG